MYAGQIHCAQDVGGMNSVLLSIISGTVIGNNATTDKTNKDPCKEVQYRLAHLIGVIFAFAPRPASL